MIIDKKYCLSSFFQFRFIENQNYTFHSEVLVRRFLEDFSRDTVSNKQDLHDSLKNQLSKIKDFSKVALMLSSGIDSAILAKFLPKGTKAYTLKCIAEGAIDETERAKRFAKECGLDHEIIEVDWNDYEKYTPLLLRHMGQPIHSIEPQIYKAALIAKNAGYEHLIFGETADIIYGGHSIQLSKDFGLEDYIEHHNFIDPTKALVNGEIIYEPYERHMKNGKMDTYSFLNDIHYRQFPNSYINSCSLAGINFITPYMKTKLGVPLDISRIRNGEDKYIVRELFHELYPNYGQPKKLPLPRALNIWMQFYEGTTRKEFTKGYGKDLNPDQKWYLYVSELFLNLLDDGYLFGSVKQ